MNQWIVPITDGVRMGCAWAAFLLIADGWNWPPRYKIGNIILFGRPLEAMGMMMIYAYIIVIGVSISFVHRVPGMSVQSFPEHCVILFAYLLGFIGLWAAVIDRSATKIYTLLTAIFSLPVLCLASVKMVNG